MYIRKAIKFKLHDCSSILATNAAQVQDKRGDTVTGPRQSELQHSVLDVIASDS